MRKVVFFDTSVGSTNRGDEIIIQAVKTNLHEILTRHYTITYPTHTPSFHFYQQRNKHSLYSFACDADYKFIGGTNIINGNMLRIQPTWNVNIFNYHCYQNAILVGAGSNKNIDSLNIYTRVLLKKILSHSYIHSVRDEKTKKVLTSLGFDSIVTGCPTLWRLEQSHCKAVPTTKSESVVFTLTHYRRDDIYDQMLVDKLCKCYKTVYFWSQDYSDFNYFHSLENVENIKVINPSLEAFSAVLQSGVDYVGTRLHAGVYAMQHKVRTLIIIVDNRAYEMNYTSNINAIERTALDHLEDLVSGDIHTDIKLDKPKIEEWMSQFI